MSLDICIDNHSSSNSIDLNNTVRLFFNHIPILLYFIIQSKIFVLNSLFPIDVNSPLVPNEEVASWKT